MFYEHLVKDLKLGEDEIMLSFDVKSLFTNVPVQEAVDVILNILKEDESLEDRTVLTPDVIAELLRLCLNSTYFVYQGKYYEQKEGAAMGSPVSAVMANLYMEFFEELALTSSPVTPVLWKRYVDDTFCVMKRDEVDVFFQHLNSIRPSIQFTVELEDRGTLPFLDCKLTRISDGSLSIKVYRKNTHTDRYLNFKSHNPSSVKRGVVKCLFDRAEKLVTTEVDMLNEKEHLSNVLERNDYPRSFVCSSTTHHPEVKEKTTDSNEVRIIIPYTKGMSEDIRRVCRSYGITTVFKSSTTIRGLLTRVKDKLSVEQESSVVYKVPCTCGSYYIGETVRRLETRLREQCKRGETEKSAVAEHAWTEEHPILWDQTKVIDRANRQDVLRFKEALHIQTSNGHFNRDVGTDIPQCWPALLNLNS